MARTLRRFEILLPLRFNTGEAVPPALASIRLIVTGVSHHVHLMRTKGD